MCHKPDDRFFDTIAAMDPPEVCARSGARFDGEGRTYILRAFECDYRIDPRNRLILPSESDSCVPCTQELGLLLVMYLIGARNVNPAGEWTNEYSLKGGAQFFRGPHAVPNEELSTHFGSGLDEFRRACVRAGGTAVEMGDAAYRFQVLPRIPAVVVFWFADDEFPASAKLLFDPTVERHLPLDVIFALSVELYGRIMGRREQRQEA
jgi:hypothetical protein